MVGSYVQVAHVPASASAQELQQLFSQLGHVTHVIASFDASQGDEGLALVAYADAAAAQEAVDLLDSYPVGQSLLEVQTVSVHNFVGQLASRMLAQRGAAPGAPPPPAAAAAAAPGSSWAAGLQPAPAAGGGAGLAALEAEMRELQLSLQQQAESTPGGLSDWFEAEAHPAAAAAQEDPCGEGWREAVARPRRSGGGGQQQQGAGGRGSPGERVNESLWIGSIGIHMERADLMRVLCRFGPVAIDKMVAANEVAPGTTKHYKWAIVRFQHLEAAVECKEALDKQLWDTISDIPLKAVYYDPSHKGSAKRR